MLAEAGEPGITVCVPQCRGAADPGEAEVLGYEAQYLGKAELVRGESFEEIPNGKGGYTAEYIPATVDLSATKEEVRAGDRLPAPARPFLSYTPAPRDGGGCPSGPSSMAARRVALRGPESGSGHQYGFAGRTGARPCAQPAHQGRPHQDMTDSNKAMVKLPSEVNGTAMRVPHLRARVPCAAAGNPQRRARRRPLGQPWATRRGRQHVSPRGIPALR